MPKTKKIDNSKLKPEKTEQPKPEKPKRSYGEIPWEPLKAGKTVKILRLSMDEMENAEENAQYLVNLYSKYWRIDQEKRKCEITYKIDKRGYVFITVNIEEKEEKKP